MFGPVGSGLRAPRPGHQISSRQMRQQIDALRRVARLGTVPIDKGHGLLAINTGSGLQLVNNQYVPFWARLVSQAEPAVTTLDGGISNSDTTLTVLDASDFPAAGPFVIQINDELLLVTAVAGTTFSVARGLQATTPAGYADGAEVSWVYRPYLFQQLYQIEEGAWTDDLDNRDSGSSPPYVYAYEVNDRPVPADTVVQLWLERGGALGEYYVFDSSVTTSLVVENDLPWGITTTLSGSITPTESTLSVAAAGKFPAMNKFVVQIDDEMLLVGAPNTGTNTWSEVIRGFGRTTPAAHSSGATVTLIPGNPIADVTRILASMVLETYGGEEGELYGTISNATNASPIVITSTGHGLSVGDIVRIVGVLGNTAANGLFRVTAVTTNTFTIAATGNGAYTEGGEWRLRNTDPDGVTILNQLQPIDVVSGPDEDKFYQGYRLEYEPAGETLDTKEDIYAIDLNQF